MHKIIILNAKGGSGRTTLATNLAACLANRGRYPALFDYDPQGSALSWLHTRPKDVPPIHGVEAHRKKVTVTRSWQMRMPKDVDCIVIDTPGGLAGAQLADYIRQADTIIIPVLPSPVDVHVAINFIKEITTLGKIKTRRSSASSNLTRLAVVGNKVQDNTRVYRGLCTFLDDLDLPFLTALADSQYYVHSFVEGLGVQEIRDTRVQMIIQQWQPLLDWLDDVPQQLSSVPLYKNTMDVII
ncbi:MAG: ParA family protein [Gammaproteobacteria bacterium]|nr:ParA family protein [Gammaproteobacteria bacterium]MDH5800784.1 ParA family protein [Gammaproteobacteria bacterium]